MSQQKHLDEAFQAARALSEADQEALASEIMARVGELKKSVLTEEQRAEVKARLAAPPVYADPAEVTAFFERHDAR